MLYNGLLFPGGEGDKDQVYSDRGAACHPGGNDGRRGAYKVDGVNSREHYFSQKALTFVWLNDKL